MNVIIYGHPPTYKTGLGKLTKLMMDSLKKLNHQPYCMTKFPLQGPNDGYKIIAETPENSNSLISSFTDKGDVDLIISIGDFWDMETPYMLTQKKAIPWIAWMGLEGSTFPKYAQVSTSQMMDCCMVANATSAIWTFSNHAAKAIKENTPDLNYQRSVEVLHPSVDVDRIQKAKPFPLKKYLGIPDDKQILGFVGDNLYRKGIDLFIEFFTNNFYGGDEIAYIHSPTVKPQIGFNLKEMLRSYGIEDRVYLKEDLQKKYSDQFTDDDIYGLYKSFDCFFHPHRAEGFGLCVLEAMIAGTQTYCTPFGGVMDFLIPNDNSINTTSREYIQAGGVGYMGVEPTSYPIDSKQNDLKQFNPKGFYISDFENRLEKLLKIKYQPVITRRVL